MGPLDWESSALAARPFITTGKKCFQIQLLDAVAQRCSVKKFYKISAIFTGKHKHWSLFLIKLQVLQHRWKEIPTQVSSYEYCGILMNSFFIENFWWLLLDFFTGSQKETIFSVNCSVMKTFKCSFSVDFLFNMWIRCSECTTQPEAMFYSVDFLIVIIYQYFLFLYMPKIKNYIACTCVNPPLLLLPIIIFIVLLLFGINFEFNFSLNFDTQSLSLKDTIKAYKGWRLTLL